MCPGQIKARALPIYTFLFLKKDATRTHSPLFRTSAQSWASVLLKAGLCLSLPGATDGSEPGAASGFPYVQPYRLSRLALLLVYRPVERVWPSGTFHWRPYLRLALKYTFPRARPKPANVGKNGHTLLPCVVQCLLLGQYGGHCKQSPPPAPSIVPGWYHYTLKGAVIPPFFISHRLPENSGRILPPRKVAFCYSRSHLKRGTTMGLLL